MGIRCRRRRAQAEDDSDKKITSALDALEMMGIVAPGEKEREAKEAAEKAERQARSDKAKADFKAATAAKLAAQAAAPAAPTPASTTPSAAAPDNTPVVDTPKKEVSQQSALDRMLGIEEDVAEKAAKPAAKAQGEAADKPKVTVSDDAIKELMDVRACLRASLPRTQRRRGDIVPSATQTHVLCSDSLKFFLCFHAKNSRVHTRVSCRSLDLAGNRVAVWCSVDGDSFRAVDSGGGGCGMACATQVERQRGNPGLTKESEGKMKASFDSVNKLAKQEEELSDEETARLQVRSAATPHTPDLATPLK